MVTFWNNKRKVEEKEKSRKIGMDKGAAWAIAYISRDGDSQLAQRMAREWGFRSLVDLKDIDPYDCNELFQYLDK